MAAKNWLPSALWNQSFKETDLVSSSNMRRISGKLRVCGSKTLWEVVKSGHNSRRKKAESRGENPLAIPFPKVEEAVEWVGEVGGTKGALKTLGLASCKSLACPICCYSRSLLRRSLALEWAEQRDWSDYHVAALTFTVPHRLYDSQNLERFKKVLDNLLLSLSKFARWVTNKSTPIKKSVCSLFPNDLGFISSLEFTFGKNGLHPHFHTLFFTKSSDDIVKLRKWFRKDRVRVWRSTKALLRLPKANEELGFKMIAEPRESGNLESVLSYITKGLFETISAATKDIAKKDSKTVFQLRGEDLRYFCIFYDAVRGKRFYRSGGICKEIKMIKTKRAEERSKREDEMGGAALLKQCFSSLVRISQKDNFIPSDLVSKFVREFQRTLDERVVSMTSYDIKKMVTYEWNDFLEREAVKRKKDAVEFEKKVLSRRRRDEPTLEDFQLCQ